MLFLSSRENRHFAARIASSGEKCSPVDCYFVNPINDEVERVSCIMYNLYCLPCNARNTNIIEICELPIESLLEAMFKVLLDSS